MTIRPMFAWYDLWIGVFYDRAKRKVYVMPLPCLGFVVTLDSKPGQRKPLKGHHPGALRKPCGVHGCECWCNR